MRLLRADPQKAGEGAVGIAHMARVAKRQLCTSCRRVTRNCMSYVALVFVFPLPRPLGAVPLAPDSTISGRGEPTTHS